MARTAAELYRLLTAQGRGEKEISMIVELLSGR
jgi:3-hydroxyisobutyrate dehydrogenase-like beta-hydroxyacid dehydrogenase